MDKAAELQGLSPTRPSLGRLDEIITVSPSLTAVAYDYREDRYDGTWETMREIYRDPDQHLIVLSDLGVALDLRSPAHRDASRRLARRVPHVVLEEILENPATFGEADRPGEGARVHGVLSDGTPVVLTLRNNLLRRLEYETELAGSGPVTFAWEYDDYRTIGGGLLFPQRYESSIGGRPYTSMRVHEVGVGEATIEDRLNVPSGVSIRPPQTVPPVAAVSAGAVVDTVAPGIYRIRNLRPGFHPVFVDLGEELVAIDAPAGYRLLYEIPASELAPGPSADWLSARAIEIMRSVLPDSPVRHVIVTHHHADHAGGLRAFVDAGASVLVSAADEAAIRDQLDDWDPPAPGGDPAVRVVDGSLELAGSRRSVVALEVGRNPHSEGMLVVSLPADDALFVSDLLDPTPDPEDFPRAEHAALDRWFADWLRRSRLDFTTIYTMHGSGEATSRHLSRLRGADSARNP